MIHWAPKPYAYGNRGLITFSADMLLTFSHHALKQRYSGISALLGGSGLSPQLQDMAVSIHHGS